MFNLTFREKIVQIIIKTYYENIDIYKSYVRKRINKNFTGQEIMEIISSATAEYEQYVWSYLNQVNSNSPSPSISARFSLALTSPNICWINTTDDIFSKPAILYYAIMYWAYYDKKYDMNKQPNKSDTFKILTSINSLFDNVNQEIAYEIATVWKNKIIKESEKNQNE